MEQFLPFLLLGGYVAFYLVKVALILMFALLLILLLDIVVLLNFCVITQGDQGACGQLDQPLLIALLVAFGPYP